MNQGDHEGGIREIPGKAGNLKSGIDSTGALSDDCQAVTASGNENELVDIGSELIGEFFPESGRGSCNDSPLIGLVSHSVFFYLVGAGMTISAFVK